MVTMLNPDAIPEGVLDTAIITETEGLSSYTIMPNVLTKLGTLASSVTLSLNTTGTGTNIVNIYDFIFITSTTAPNIT